MGKVLLLCPESPAQLALVYGEPLLSRTVRQVRKLMNNHPHIISNQKCLRSYSTNYITPSAHRWQCEILRSVLPIWGNDFTMVLMGNVMYTDELIESIYKHREKYNYHFYGTSQDIFAISFTDNELIRGALVDVNTYALFGNGKGRLWDLYYHLKEKPIPSAGEGYKGEEDDLHYTYVVDESIGFNSLEEYREWTKTNKGT